MSLGTLDQGYLFCVAPLFQLVFARSSRGKSWMGFRPVEMNWAASGGPGGAAAFVVAVFAGFGSFRDADVEGVVGTL